MIIYFIGSFIAMWITYRELRKTDEDDVVMLGASFLAFFLSWISIIIFFITYLIDEYKDVGFSNRIIKILDKIFMVRRDK